MKSKWKCWLMTVAVLMVAHTTTVGAFTLKELSVESETCVACHKVDSTSIYEQWGESKHDRANVWC